MFFFRKDRLVLALGTCNLGFISIPVIRESKIPAVRTRHYNIQSSVTFSLLWYRSLWNTSPGDFRQQESSLRPFYWNNVHFSIDVGHFCRRFWRIRPLNPVSVHIYLEYILDMNWVKYMSHVTIIFNLSREMNKWWFP